jgi:DNA-directed RNA polymerase specialized sigma24 family protein
LLPGFLTCRSTERKELAVSVTEARNHFNSLFASERNLIRLQAYLRNVFPNLKERVQDVVQEVLCEVLSVFRPGSEQAEQSSEKLQALLNRLDDYRRQGLSWEETWMRYMRRLLRWRGIDLLRAREFSYFESMTSQTPDDSSATRVEPQAAIADPSIILGEAERRQRQVRLLSDIFREFVSWCESNGQALKKEVYERRLRDQKADEVARALGLGRNHVDQLIKRARDWIRERIEKRDVHRSVFLTLHRQPRNSLSLPETTRFSNFAEVLRFVINEMGALCPSETRLLQYRANPSHPDYHDVHYHVREAACRLCNADLEK